MVTRSPNYPSMDMKTALEAVAPVWKAERRNKMGRMTLAKHLGYSSLSGRSLAKIGALRAYGLIEGSGDELRVSNDAMICLEAPPGSVDRKEALERMATKPSLFKEIRADFPDSTLPSESNLTFALIKKDYTPDAAGKAARAYLATMRLVAESGNPYTPGEDEAEESQVGEEIVESQSVKQRKFTPPPPPPAAKRQAIFPLDEGDVTLSFPADLSSEGYAELKAYLEIFLNKAERQKRQEEAREEFSGEKSN